jgi:uncharacterized repeat protein (TIGR03803 family)
MGGSYNNYGTIFSITPAGALTTLHKFHNADGAYPSGGLIQGTDGNLYGVTAWGGAFSAGTIFKLTPGGTLTTFHAFNVTDGSQPIGGLIQATDGNFYGSTASGGSGGHGTIFQITLQGTLTTLHSFVSSDGSGSGSEGALVQGTDGNFYGTSTTGGSNSGGTVFSLSVGLGPFVKTLPTSGKVGAAVKILGTNLTGATSVGFHGTAAAFTVVSASEISATVPAGATTGKVRVTTPEGTLLSDVAFRVRP